jgi:hypothetical protein
MVNFKKNLRQTPAVVSANLIKTIISIHPAPSVPRKTNSFSESRAKNSSCTLPFPEARSFNWTIRAISTAQRKENRKSANSECSVSLFGAAQHLTLEKSLAYICIYK